MKTEKLNIERNSIVAHEDETRKTFEDLKRDFERAYLRGDYAVELMELSNVIALSVLNKCIDPQRSTAPQRDAVSNTGFNPAMIAVKRGLLFDIRALRNLAECDARCAHLTYNANGDAVEMVDDKDARDALKDLSGECLTDGIDLAQTACVALLEMASKYANGDGWLDARITVRQIKRKVLIKESDTVAYEDVETAPMREVYRAVRRAIMASRAVSTDPRNGYTYIEEMTEDGLDTVYLRMGKYADIGGYNCNGLYTASCEDVRTYSDIIKALNLTDRQMRIIELRMRGYGLEAIGTYLGVHYTTVQKTLLRLRKKCENVGFTPYMWEEMNK